MESAMAVGIGAGGMEVKTEDCRGGEDQRLAMAGTGYSKNYGLICSAMTILPFRGLLKKSITPNNQAWSFQVYMFSPKLYKLNYNEKVGG